MKNRRAVLWNLLLPGLFAWQSMIAAEWSRWRGPNANSISDEAIALTPWTSQGPQRLWTNSVGTGFSSIAVAQGRVFTLGNSNETDSVFCMASGTGQVVWQYSYACPLDPNLYEGGPSSTPTVEGDRVYTLSKFGHLFCFDAGTGAIRWQTNLIDDLGLRKPIWGFAGSPLVLGEKLILNAGGHGLALNKTNGTVLWRSDTNRCGYSSPVFYTDNGTQAVVMFSERRVVAARVDNGNPLWSHPWATSFDMNIADITVFNGDFFITSYNRSAILLDVVGSSSALVWSRPTFSTILSPGVLLGNSLYTFHDDTDEPAEGELRCLDMTTGNVAWATNMWTGSILSADNKLIILTGNGELVLAEANPNSYVELARAQVMPGRCWTMPALSGGRLYCRNAAGQVVALNIASTTSQPPNLFIARVADPARVRIAWPTNAVNFRLESADALALGATWSEVTTLPAVEGDSHVLETGSVSGSRFYRLQKP